MLCDQVIFRQSHFKYSNREYFEQYHEQLSFRVAGKTWVCVLFWFYCWERQLLSVSCSALYKSITSLTLWCLAAAFKRVKVPEGLMMSPKDRGAGLRYVWSVLWWRTNEERTDLFPLFSFVQVLRYLTLRFSNSFVELNKNVSTCISRITVFLPLTFFWHFGWTGPLRLLTLLMKLPHMEPWCLICCFFLWQDLLSEYQR